MAAPNALPIPCVVFAQFPVIVQFVTCALQSKRYAPPPRVSAWFAVRRQPASWTSVLRAKIPAPNSARFPCERAVANLRYAAALEVCSASERSDEIGAHGTVHERGRATITEETAARLALLLVNVQFVYSGCPPPLKAPPPDAPLF